MRRTLISITANAFEVLFGFLLLVYVLGGEWAAFKFAYTTALFSGMVTFSAASFALYSVAVIVSATLIFGYVAVQLDIRRAVVELATRTEKPAQNAALTVSNPGETRG